MKKLLIILIIFTSCKSSKSTTNNQLDIKRVKTTSESNTFNISHIDLTSKEIKFITANPKEETTITDAKGNTQTFKNVKEVVISDKKEVKKDTTSTNKKDTSDSLIDNSKIKGSSESVSDANNYKWIFISIAVIAVCALIIWLKK